MVKKLGENYHIEINKNIQKKVLKNSKGGVHEKWLRQKSVIFIPSRFPRTYQSKITLHIIYSGFIVFLEIFFRIVRPFVDFENKFEIRMEIHCF